MNSSSTARPHEEAVFVLPGEYDEKKRVAVSGFKESTRLFKELPPEDPQQLLSKVVPVHMRPKRHLLTELESHLSKRDFNKVSWTEIDMEEI